MGTYLLAAQRTVQPGETKELLLAQLPVCFLKSEKKKVQKMTLSFDEQGENNKTCRKQQHKPSMLALLLALAN